jgi:uncharacterized membrane protein YeaQ/YmgE (transglycosylase-associated protein family)
MSIAICVFIGLVTAFVANRTANGSGQGTLVDVILGVIGAVVGAAALRHFDQAAAAAVNAWSVLASAAGAFAVLVALRLVTGRRSHA